MIGLEFYVTEIVFWLGFADVIFGGTSDRRKYVCVRRLGFNLMGFREVREEKGKTKIIK